MTRVLAGAGAPRRVVPAIERRAEDRWLAAPVRRVSLAMSGVVLASLLIHAGLLLFATLGETPRVAKPEITVELLQEPKPEPKAEPKPEVKAPEKPAAEAPKAETPKVEEAKPEPPKAPEAKTEAPTPEPVKPEPPKPEPKADVPKPELRRTQAEPKPVEAPKAPEPKAEPPAEDKLAEREAAMKSMEKELESLKAEQAALRAEQQQAADPEPPATPLAPPAAAPPSMLAEPKIGGIPSSFAAVALPGLSEIDGIATGYQELVFSQLAKAKGIRRHMGIPGTAGVVFSVDKAGKLVKASIAHASGSEALDKEALDIVMAAGPFPKPPPGAERTFSANFSFVPQAAP